MSLLQVDPALAPELERFQEQIGNAIASDLTAALQAAVHNQGDVGLAFSDEVQTLGLLDAALAPAVAVVLTSNLERDGNLAKTIAQLVMLRMRNSELQLVRKQ